MFRLLLTLPILLAACQKDETVSGFTDPSATYKLVEINGTPFDGKASVAFPAPGSITGKGPCNSFGAELKVPYPWLELGPIRATRTACHDLPLEKKFFKALGSMTQIEAQAGTLILRNEAGGEMVFRTKSP